MAKKEKKTILLVDDERDILNSLSSFLKRNGYGILTADNGQEGLRLAKDGKPDLIILDLVLPDIDGSDVAVGLLADPATRKTPLIFLTGVLTQAEQEKYGRIIANRCIIAKPFRPEEILALVKERIGLAV
jgi:DNA-binding response OmpR family regulator